MNQKFVRCPKCHTINPASARGCRKCGYALQELGAQPVAPAGEPPATPDVAPSGPRKKDSGQWTMGGRVPVADDSFTMGGGEAGGLQPDMDDDGFATPDSITYHGDDQSSWTMSRTGRSKRIKTHVDRREALVETLRTIDGVIRKRRENVSVTRSPGKTVPALGAPPRTVEQAHDPFSDYLVKPAAGNRPKAAAAPGFSNDMRDLDDAGDPAASRLRGDNGAGGGPDQQWDGQGDTLEDYDTAGMEEQLAGLYSTTVRDYQEPPPSGRLDAEVDMASFSARLGAFLLDLLILSLPPMVMAWLGLYLAGKGNPLLFLVSYQGLAALQVVGVTWFFSLVCYFTLFSWVAGATPGKMLFGLKVIGWYGETPGLLRSLVRSLCYVVDAAVFGLGFLMVFVTSNRQALHDKVIETLVIRD